MRRRTAPSLFAALDSPDGSATERYIGPKSSPEYQREWRKKNIAKVRASEEARRAYHRAYNKTWRKRHANRLSLRDRRNLLRKYGLTPEIYDRMIVEQGNRCAICKQPAVARPRHQHARLDIDHCHATNRVRGLLCFNCNTLPGNARDSVAVLRAAIEYIELWNKTERSA